MLQGINGAMRWVCAGLERPQAPGAPSHWGGAPGPTMTSTFLEVLPLGSKVTFSKTREVLPAITRCQEWSHTSKQACGDGKFTVQS